MSIVSFKKLIEHVLSQPTAPFRESWVKQALVKKFNDEKLPFFEDSFGNFWIGPSNLRQARQSELVFISHLDHPGIIVQRIDWKEDEKSIGTAQGIWLGGGPMDIRNKKVLVFSHADLGFQFTGTVYHHTNGARGPNEVHIKLDASKHNKESRKAIDECIARNSAWGACLWFPKNVEFKKNLCWTKAADDLMGVCSLLHAYSNVYRQNKHVKNKISLIFTRAEESGFHGTLGILLKKWLNPGKTVMISVEASAVRPGGVLHGGPVLRLGDKMSLFQTEMINWMKHQGVALQKKSPSFQFQAQIMSGGSCEASAFQLFGFKVGGFSIPLLNYHNLNGKREAVSLQDSIQLCKWLESLFKNYQNKSQILDHSRLVLKELLENHKKHAVYF